MGYLVSWHIPNRVYLMQVWGEIDIEELRQGSEAAIEFVRQGVAPVHCIGDARYIRQYPVNLAQMKVATQVLREPNLGYFLFLSNNSVLNMFGSVMSQMSNVKFNSFNDPNTLISVLQNLDDSLPPLPPYDFPDPLADH